MNIFLIGCILGARFWVYMNNNNGNHDGRTHIPSGWIKNGNTIYKLK